MANGDFYQGGFQQGVRHGYGIYSFADGSSYKVLFFSFG